MSIILNMNWSNKKIKFFLKKWFPVLVILHKSIMDISQFFYIRVIAKNYNHLKKEIKYNNKNINVYFLVTQKQLWNATTLYQKMKKAEHFKPVVIVFPNYENSTCDPHITLKDNLEFFNNLDVSVISGMDVTGSLLSPDELLNKPSIVFFDQTCLNLGKSWSFANVSKASLICYIPYGFKIANNNNNHYNQEIHNYAWKLFIETNWHEKMYKKLGKLEAQNTVVTGYPKFDLYLGQNSKQSISIHNIKEKSRNRKIVIWAPHWSINDGLLNYSTFDIFYRNFIDLRDKYKDLFFIFKPHQRLRHYITEIGFMSEHDVSNYYSNWDNCENSTLYDGADYIDLFKLSSAMITDSGSFLAEYLPSKGPLLLLRSNHSVGYNTLGAELIKQYYSTSDYDGIQNFLNKQVIEEFDPMKQNRQAFLKRIWTPEEGPSSDLIIKHIKEKLWNRSKV
jgi:hypothetical protein